MKILDIIINKKGFNKKHGDEKTCRDLCFFRKCVYMKGKQENP